MLPSWDLAGDISARAAFFFSFPKKEWNTKNYTALRLKRALSNLLVAVCQWYHRKGGLAWVHKWVIMSNTYDCFATSSEWSKEGSYAYNLTGLQEIVWYSSLQRAALQPWSPKAEGNVAKGGGEGKQVFKKGKETTARALQKSLRVSFGEGGCVRVESVRSVAVPWRLAQGGRKPRCCEGCGATWVRGKQGKWGLQPGFLKALCARISFLKEEEMALENQTSKAKPNPASSLLPAGGTLLLLVSGALPARRLSDAQGCESGLSSAPYRVCFMAQSLIARSNAPLPWQHTYGLREGHCSGNEASRHRFSASRSVSGSCYLLLAI